MKLFSVVGLAVAMTLGLAQAASAVTIFTANLTESQEVTAPAPLGASGNATLVLNNAMTRLDISIQLFGLDLDGLQTLGTIADDVTALHIHAAAAGVNGGVVFGFISPNHDLNGDLMIDPVAGTLIGGWDVGEGNGTDIVGQLGNLFSRGLYLNVHTTASPGGQIRGQLISEPVVPGMLAAGLALVGWLRRRA